MFDSFIITFREGFEMALVVSLLLAATKGTTDSKKWILGGTGIGLVISLTLGVMALSSDFISSLIQNKITNFLILIFAATLIAYTVIWMKIQGRKMATDIKEKVNAGNAVKSLGLVALLTIVREGAEIVLFTLGLMANDNSIGTINIAIGALGGAVSAGIIGVMMYLGLIRVNISKVFNTFSFLMTFLAAGMYANAVSKLVKAKYLTLGSFQVWDTSAYFDHHSNPIALFAHVIFGYAEKPYMIQIITYIAALVIIFSMSSHISKKA
ncbi:iron permease [Shewanella sp. NFH-SH190041]|uniref:FTR1 family iron permease n=1 Tax=Shewanella sp. NFH-SH190041 TaxID=2950245 RepID=UPI0021C2F6F6|nr:FTR1 family protein [Shewanella sp. NFH-SH190041]BDM63241.1 iron permease [Shewanella sp. NFH-SH190041]